MSRLFLVALVLGLATSTSYAQEREWQLDATDEDAFLVFGVPQSDDVGVSFWCKLGSNRLKVMSPLPRGRVKGSKSTPIVVRVGGKEFGLRGTPGIGPKGTLESVEAETPAQGPLLDALQANDRFTLRVGNHDATYPLRDADFDGLIRLCQTLPEGAQP